MQTRRGFVKNASLALFSLGMGGVPTFIVQAAASFKKINLYKKNKILICIFQRGAMDGLMAVTPFNDEFLKAARPSLFMEAGINKPLIDLDGKFGLHPAMKSFDNLFKNKQLSIVHGIGSPNNTRSHFDAQDFMESGTPYNKGTNSGWLNRAVGLLGHDITPFSAISLTSSLPRSFYGSNAAIAMSNIQDFKIQSKGINATVANNISNSFEDLYDQTSNNLLKDTGKESFDAMKLLQNINTKNYQPANNVVYPNSALGNSLKQLAQLLKLDVGLEIGFAEQGGWDTHFNQGKETGTFARSAKDLSDCISAFLTDIEQFQDDVVVMTMTEFGRTVKQNGTGGTDHGRASCNFIIGNNVDGGKVHGIIQPLTIENLEDKRDLAVTTDFRTVFNEVAEKHLLIKDTASLFPDWKKTSLQLFKN